MSDDDRKSMDDVLASIRRIVRPANPDAEAGGAEGDPLHGPSHGVAYQEIASDEPLVLTPEMRTDDSAIRAESAPADSAYLSDATQGAEPAYEEREALREALREILREELAGGAAADAVRDIIRDELTGGEIGGNISRNVVRLIQAEVAKAVDTR